MDTRAAYLTLTSASRTSLRATAYTEQTTAAQRSIKSASASDTAAGTGAQTVLITFYDNNLNGPYTELVTLNGTTAVNTVSTNICLIESMQVIGCGSGGANAGIISLFTAAAGGGSAFASIAANDNTTYWMAHYVGAGRTCYLSTLALSCSGNSGLFQLTRKVLSVPVGSPFFGSLNAVSNLRVVTTDSFRQYVLPEPFPIVGPAKIECFWTADSGVTSTTVNGDFVFIDQ